jgi:hypothetical protein
MAPWVFFGREASIFLLLEIGQLAHFTQLTTRGAELILELQDFDLYYDISKTGLSADETDLPAAPSAES